MALLHGLLLAALLAPTADPAATAARAPSAESIAELEREVRRLRGVEARYRNAERSLIGDLEALGREVALADREVDLVELRIAGGEHEAEVLAGRVHQLEAQVAALRLGLKQSLLTAYARRGPDWLAVLIGSESTADLPRNLHLIARLGARQSADVNRFGDERRALAAAAERLAATGAELKRLRGEGAARRAAAEHARLRKADLLRDVQGRKGEAVAELRQAASALSLFVTDLGQAVAASAPTDFAARKGSLPWPSDAPVSKPFGVERHPRFNTLIEHPGIDLGAPLGTTVRAIHAGQVAFADWFKGYGNLVILDHGDGYYSLYGHLQKPAVAPGARVSGGTLIGLSGDTGSLEGASLYFEIRKGEQALDPAAWLAPAAHPRRR